MPAVMRPVIYRGLQQVMPEQLLHSSGFVHPNFLRECIVVSEQCDSLQMSLGQGRQATASVKLSKPSKCTVISSILNVMH